MWTLARKWEQMLGDENGIWWVDKEPTRWKMVDSGVDVQKARLALEFLEKHRLTLTDALNCATFNTPWAANLFQESLREMEEVLK